MLAARMHGYRQPLVLEEVNIPEISSEQVLVRVAGAGMCRSDVQLVDGYFQEAIKPKFPITPGHEPRRDHWACSNCLRRQGESL
jgi:propanol-preferring alcohol dehydrogenase